MTTAAMHHTTNRDTDRLFEKLRPGMVADITYMNGSGDVSDRRIHISTRYCSRAGIWYLRAYCHLREEERTFREDRVLSVRRVHAPAHGAAPAGAHGAAHAGAPAAGSTTAYRTSPSHRSSHAGRRFLGFVAAVVVIVFLAVRDAEEWSPRPDPTPAPDTLVDRAAAADLPAREAQARADRPQKGADAAAHDAGTDHLWYRGERIDRRYRAGSVTYSVDGVDRSFTSLQEARLAINRREFVATTGISNRELLRRYAHADTNADGDLDWQEIRVFQRRLYSEYRYLTNDIALTPDSFFRNGGGDCEDWSLVTAGLLQFWQIPAYVASIASETGFHAVALVRTSRPPAGALYFTFEDHWDLPDGAYVPIDYDKVGGLTNAVGPAYRVRAVWVPHTLYNRHM
ncbi:MAG: WYL domain-containing protein [Spirochaetota bacterium]